MIYITALNQMITLISGLGALVVILSFYAHFGDRKAKSLIHFLVSYLLLIIILNIPLLPKYFFYHYVAYSDYLYYYLFVAYVLGLVIYFYSSFIFELVNLSLAKTQRWVVFALSFLPLYLYIPMMIWSRTVYDLSFILYVFGFILILSIVYSNIILIRSYKKLIGLWRKIAFLMAVFSITYSPFIIVDLFFPEIRMIKGGDFPFFNLFFLAFNALIIPKVLLIILKRTQREKVAHIQPKIEFSQEVLQMYGLSEREREIAVAILEGKTNNEIAQEKFISITTVKKHVYNIFQKTNVRNRIELNNVLRNGK